MPDDLRRLVAKHAANGVLADANVLLLLLVGLLDPDLISRHKRTHSYTVDDFGVLHAFLRRFRRIVTTPHILAEVGNLGRQIGEPAKSDFLRLLASRIGELSEEPVASRTFSQVGEHVYPRLGLTDSLTIVTAGRGFLVLSDDLELVGELSAVSADVVNFAHLRPLA